MSDAFEVFCGPDVGNGVHHPTPLGRLACVGTPPNCLKTGPGCRRCSRD